MPQPAPREGTLGVMAVHSQCVCSTFGSMRHMLLLNVRLPPFSMQHLLQPAAYRRSTVRPAFPAWPLGSKRGRIHTEVATNWHLPLGLRMFAACSTMGVPAPLSLNGASPSGGSRHLLQLDSLEEGG